jgi:cytochrome c biogenesis factor
MPRRRTIEEPPSRLAIWARRVALFSLAATLIAVIIVRSGALEIVPAGPRKRSPLCSSVSR